MKHLVHYLAILGGCCLVLLPQPQARAEAVYTWVDNFGVTHFSQTPPPDPGTEPAIIELNPPPPPPEYNDYYSVIRQAERMQRRRLENEKLEAERLQAEAEALRARAEAKAVMQSPGAYTNEAATVYAPVYPYYYYPRHRPGYGNKPRPPGYWPVRPGQPGHLPGTPGFRPQPHRVISAIPAQR
jgi:hypothetical protein